MLAQLQSELSRIAAGDKLTWGQRQQAVAQHLNRHLAPALQEQCSEAGQARNLGRQGLQKLAAQA